MNVLSTEVHIIEEHNLICSEEPVLAMSAAVAAAAAAVRAAAISAAAAAEGGVSGMVRKAAVNGLIACDIMPADVFGPPKGLQGLVSHPRKKLDTILSLLASASTCHKSSAIQS